MVSVETVAGIIDSARADVIREQIACADRMKLSAKNMARPTNKQISALEVYDFVNTPPDRYFAYVIVNADDGSDMRKVTWASTWAPHRVKVTTWPGDRLTVDNVRLGKVWRSNMGDRRRAIRFRAINGRTYAGTYYFDSGNYCRVKMVKGA